MLGRPRHWDYWWDFAFMQEFERFLHGLVDKGVTMIPPLSDIQKLPTKTNLIRAPTKSVPHIAIICHNLDTRDGRVLDIDEVLYI